MIDLGGRVVAVIDLDGRVVAVIDLDVVESKKKILKLYTICFFQLRPLPYLS